jgi:phosphoribosylaminoimidazole carboxylase (NCAIR synthetase)
VANTHLHLYGKEPRPGRKVGHLTVRADQLEKLQKRLQELPKSFHRPEFCLGEALGRSRVQERPVGYPA